jgi:hypothetical protein
LREPVATNIQREGFAALRAARLNVPNGWRSMQGCSQKEQAKNILA